MSSSNFRNDKASQFSPRHVIDLTQDEDESEDKGTETQSLLAKFTQSKTGRIEESRSLKKRSPDVSHAHVPTDIKPEVNANGAGLTPGSNGLNDASTARKSFWPWAASAAADAKVKLDSRPNCVSSIAPPTFQTHPQRQLRPEAQATHFKRPTKHAVQHQLTPQTKTSAPAAPSLIKSQVQLPQIHLPCTQSPQIQPLTKLSSQNQTQAPTVIQDANARDSLQLDSSYVSSMSGSEKSYTRERSLKRKTQSTSPFTEAGLSTRRTKLMVVVPPPPTAAKPDVVSKPKMSQRIVRLPSVSVTPDGFDESDPGEPKGIKTKYYPIDLYKNQAARGRYPPARKTKPEAVTLSQRPQKIPRPQIRAPHSQMIYLRALLDKKLRSIHGPPVTMAAGWDGVGSLASNFEFTNRYKLQQGVTRVSEEFNGGCSCGLQCDPQKCQCLSQEEDSEALMVPYEHRDGKLLLKESFIQKKTMIYECNSRCGCTRSCWNRLVQHGRTIRLEIFHTGSRGFGLRSPEYIHRGQFIDTYLGEVITSAEAELREDAAGSQNSPSYLFSLDWFPAQNNAGSDDEDDDDVGGGGDNDGNGNDENEEEYYVVDGQRFGGPSRFMNHSCNPNCKMFPVSTHHGDERIYDLAFFALRDIPAGSELTFDYNPHLTGEDMNTVDPSAVKCLCGEVKCRGQLWPTQRKSSNM